MPIPVCKFRRACFSKLPNNNISW